MKILIIGGGHMGSTYVRAFIRAKTHPQDIMVLERKGASHIAVLKSLGDIAVHTTPDCIPDAAVILVAVKPQDAPMLFDSIGQYIQPDQLVVSIMAGVTIETIRQAVGTDKIIRAMPNLPAKVGYGMTAYTATPDTSRVELSILHNLLSTTGRAIYLEDEDLLDAVTAISGSGPAYVFYFMKSMMEKARALGLDELQAELMVRQTFYGAVHLYSQENLNCEAWIEQVASKGGTTEAALRVFDSEALDTNIKSGVEAAYQRAVELGIRD